MFHVCLILVSPVKSGNSANGGESSAKNRTMLLQVDIKH